MSASAIKMGGVFVEIGADPKKFFAALNRVNKSLANMGKSLVSGGTKLTAAGVGMAAPIVAAVRQGARFESVLLGIRASTGATAAEIDKIKAASLQMSQALGVGPTEAAGGMLELLKAGMSLEAVLGGAGQAALQFAKVGEMDVAQAAVVMSDAMNVFGVSGTHAANTMSAAADASSTSIAQMAEAFSMSSAVAGLANQSIDDLSATLAILANAGVKGSDAGTSVKTMLMRLMAPAEDAAQAMAEVGLSVDAFRGADGKMKPMVEIIGTLSQAMAGLDQTAKDDIFRRIFGADAIRAASILSAAGVDGFQGMRDAMAQALPVGEKFKTLMSGMAGGGLQILAALQRLAIVISDALAPALAAIVPLITGALNGFAEFASQSKEAVVTFAKVAAGAIGVGGAMVGLGLSLQVTAFAFAGLGKAALVAIAPMRLLTASALGIGGAFASAVPGVAALASATGSAMVSAGSSVARFAAQSATQLAGFASAGIGGVMSFGSALQGVFASQFRIARFIGQSFSGAIVTAFSKMVMSVGVAKSAITSIAPAVMFVGKGFAALASDAARLAGPIARPFMQGAAAVAAFASSAARSVASYVTSVASAVTATVTANAKIAVAWAGSGLKAVYSFAAGVAVGMSAYVASVAAAVGASVASAAGIAVAWLSRAFPATAAFVAGAVSGFATYIASTVMAAAASVTNAVKSGVAWVASGLPGVTAFVSGAIGGLAAYLGSCAMAVAGSVASAAAVAAAWLAPLAPFALLAAAIAGAGALAYSFRGQIASAFSGVGELVGQASSAIGDTFSSAIADATVVFSDLYSIASTTFSGIYDAIAAGDLSGAMSIAWAGVQAVFLRGVEAILSAWYTAIGEIKKAFVSVGSAWDTNVTKPISMFGVRVAEAAKERAVLGAFDTTQGTVFDNESKKAARSRLKVAENLLSSSTVEGFAANRSAAETTMQSLQGVVDVGMGDGATDEQRKAGAAAAKEIEAFKSAIQMVQERFAQLGIKTAEERQAAIDQAKAEIDAVTQNNLSGIDLGAKKAQQRLTDLTSAAAAKRSDVEAIAGVQEALQSVQSLTELGKIGEQISGIMDRDTLTAEQEQKAIDAYNAAQKRIVAETQPTGDAAAQVVAGAGAAGEQSQQSMGSIAGTFSSLNLGAAFGGTTAAERTAKATEEIARNTRNMDGARVAA